MDKEEEEMISHLLWWSLLKRGGHYFHLESRKRERDLFLAFTPMDQQDRSTVLCEPVLELQARLCQTTTTSNTHKREKKCPAYIIIGLSDEYTDIAVMKSVCSELQTF